MIDFNLFTSFSVYLFILMFILTIGGVFWFLFSPSKKKSIQEESQKDFTESKETKNKNKKIQPEKTIRQNRNEIHSSKKNLKKETKIEDQIKLVSIKGHTDSITNLCWSPNGKFLATAAVDRTLRIYEAKTLEEKIPRFIRINLPFDHVTSMDFTGDSHHIIVSFCNSKEIVVFRINSKKDEEGKQYKEVYRFPTENLHANDIISLSVSTNNKFILTCSEELLVLWTLKGKRLETIDMNQVKNSMASISPDCKYFTSAGWTGDVKLFEISYKKNEMQMEDYSGTSKIAGLAGHRSAVYCVDFGIDTSRTLCATASKDGTWKLWKINVRYHLGEDPQCLLTIQSPHYHDRKEPFHAIKISPDCKRIAVSSGSTLYFYSSKDGKLLHEITGAHSSLILGLGWSPDSNVLGSFSENQIHLWKLPL